MVTHTGRITRPLTPSQTPGFAGQRPRGGIYRAPCHGAAFVVVVKAAVDGGDRTTRLDVRRLVRGRMSGSY
jgi:hypothetical protein